MSVAERNDYENVRAHDRSGNDDALGMPDGALSSRRDCNGGSSAPIRRVAGRGTILL
jgi:hypothetical protein